MEQKEFDNLKVGDVVKLERNGVHYVKIINGPLYQSAGGLGKSFKCKDLDTNRDVVIYSYDTLEKLKEVTAEEIEKHDVVNNSNHIGNTTELLSAIVKGMSEKDIELTHVDLYEEAVGINNKVKVCLANEHFLVCNINTGGGLTYYSTDLMLNRVLELLTENDWLPGDNIKNDLEWCTLVVENDCYRLLYNDYSLSDRMTLEYLRRNYTNVSLEKRLK